MKPFKWLCGSPHLTLYSPLSPAECCRAFDQNVLGEFSFSIFRIRKYAAMYGSRREDKFKLYERTKARESGTPIFRARIAASGAGSEIRGFFGLSCIVSFFTVLWVSIIFLVLSHFFLLSAMAFFHGQTHAGWTTLAAFLLLAIIASVIALMSVLRQGKEDRYVQFMSKTFDAVLLERHE
jgi:hypothetical protein